MKSLSETEWDANQKKVISADSDERIVVDAGPGTGKTAVACARLAHLISEADIEPSNTWMISFTRTAVAEIRARLHEYVGEDSFAIRVATLDSHAWSIHAGHDPNSSLTGSYEDNIESVAKLIATDEDVQEELSRVEHVIIDEAQDLVGVRADLIVALIEKLPIECGVTVFADEAQAIYGFTDDGVGEGESVSEASGKSLTERLRTQKGASFKTLSLAEIYRTSSSGLRKIFSELRNEVLDPENRHPGLHAETVQKIEESANKSGLKFSRTKVADFSSGDLILYRSRAEVLLASQLCEQPHRLRLSGYGATLPAWLALCFFDFDQPVLGQRKFFELWSERAENRTAPECDSNEAWSSLVRVAGKSDGSVDMRQLRRRLGQSRPPVELAISEYGFSGPIVGTIHASKGREAGNVAMFFPNNASFGCSEDEAEEARVLFVGATRAMNTLVVGKGPVSYAKTLDSGRTWRWTKNGKVMIEIGRDNDISATGLVGRKEFNTMNAAAIAQRFLSKNCDKVICYTLYADSDLDWRHRILAPDGKRRVGFLTRNLGNDLWEVVRKNSKKENAKPPSWINHVRAQGCSSLVLAKDHKDIPMLHEPWASSGFMLSPRIAAFPPISIGGKKIP